MILKRFIGLFQFRDVKVTNIKTFSSLGKRPDIDYHLSLMKKRSINPSNLNELTKIAFQS